MVKTEKSTRQENMEDSNKKIKDVMNLKPRRIFFFFY